MAPHLPGFYFDEEKQKYFRIQANHQVPPNAKYSRSNVRYERHEDAKRQRIYRTEAKRAKQKVRRSKWFSPNTLDGDYLLREAGQRPPVADQIGRESEIFSKTYCEHLKTGFHGTKLGDVVQGERGLLYCINVKDWSMLGSYVPEPTDPVLPPDRMLSYHPIAYTRSDFVGLHLTAQNQMIAVARGESNESHIFLGQGDLHHNHQSVSHVRLSLGSNTYMWASDLKQDDLVISGSEKLYLFDVREGSLVRWTSLEDESRAVSWLDEHTVAYGHLFSGGVSRHGVGLWDVRSESATVQRFRMKLPATGICTPTKGVPQLLVADNKTVSLYDTRMHGQPLTTFTHQHQGPLARMDVLDDTVLAALDERNIVCLYNLRNGRALCELSVGPRLPLITSLHWFDNGQLPELRACHEIDLHRWTFGHSRRSVQNSSISFEE
ncbi:hypothetical protein K470DRAFT_259796 [Piedraia hortae CBS 480.64]|uniref:WD40 repeat-like protein n=1 Tax=Piedraia hortae CBS 480.64 TaxID=1314780 RepID=A0A6A7BUU7_9PEZI|nr:hypothetical protein K470DRAFT_259796 [Piedraia hortae CBS 480.64]